jgi:LrgA family.
MLGPLTVILLCQLVGEIIAKAGGLPIPGPVIGMVILFCGPGSAGQPVAGA